MSGSRPHRHAPDLWRSLTTDGAIEHARRDRELAQDVARGLGLPRRKPMLEELAGLSADALIRQILVTARPFVAMWSDLLTMFEKAGATYGDGQLQVVFDFDVTLDNILFAIDKFREAALVAEDGSANDSRYMKRSDHRSLEVRLREILSLPVWKRRYDLYEHWVSTRVIDALDPDGGAVVHAPGGRIDMRRRDVELAIFPRLEPVSHLWLEHRSRAINPVDFSRFSVQPDIVIRRSPLSSALDCPLVVECKHYLAPANPRFADVLTTYARAHPRACVVLVNHGPGFRAAVLENVRSDVRARVRFIPEFDPAPCKPQVNFARR